MMNRFCLVVAILVAVTVSIGCDNPAEPEPWPDGAYFYVGSNFPDTALSWSPYGSILLFTTFSFNSVALHGFDGIDNPVAITSSGMNESTGPNGCWNGENGLIAYTAWSGDSISQVRTMPGNVGAISIVLNDGMLHLHPSWSPEGDTLVMSTFADGAWGLWSGDITADSVVFAPLYQPGEDCLRPSYSPDGDWLLFQQGGTGNADIWIARPDGSDPHSVVSSSYDDIHPCWGPSDDWFAFSSDRTGNYEIWISNLDGSTQIQVTDDEGCDIYPAWNPGYGWLAFSSDRTGGTGNYDIFSIEAPELTN